MKSFSLCFLFWLASAAPVSSNDAAEVNVDGSHKLRNIRSLASLSDVTDSVTGEESLAGRASAGRESIGGRNNGRHGGKKSSSSSHGKKGSSSSDDGCFSDLMLTNTIVSTGDSGTINSMAGLNIGYGFYEVTNAKGAAVGTSTFTAINIPTNPSIPFEGNRFPSTASGVFTIADPATGCSGQIMYSGQQTTISQGDFVITGGTGDFFDASGTITIGGFDAGTFPVAVDFA